MVDPRGLERRDRLHARRALVDVVLRFLLADHLRRDRRVVRRRLRDVHRRGRAGRRGRGRRGLRTAPEAAAAGGERAATRRSRRRREAGAHGDERTDSRPATAVASASGRSPGPAIACAACAGWRFSRCATAVATAAVARPSRSAPAAAHICPVPAQIPVGQPSTIDVGVTVENATVPDVEIDVPAGLRARPGRPQGRVDVHPHGLDRALPRRPDRGVHVRVLLARRHRPGQGRRSASPSMQRTAAGTVVSRSIPDPTSPPTACSTSSSTRG